MKFDAAPVVTFDDSSLRRVSGRSLEQWFAHLDGLGGVETGRRGLVQGIHDAKKLDEWWSVTIVVEYERARGLLEKDGKPKGYSICATKTIAAPLASAFEAFGDAALLSRWLGPKAKAAFEDGGRVESADGDRWTFTRIRKDKDLRLAWEHASVAPGTPVEVLFADKGKEKCGLTLNHTRIQSRVDADRIRAGWGAAFERLKALLETAA